jgi:hypothetical protein
MRTLIISICIAIPLITTVSLSSATYADPLAPGKPAGVREAQMGNKEWLVFGGVTVLLTAVLIANVGAGDHAAVATQPITIVTPSTT